MSSKFIRPLLNSIWRVKIAEAWQPDWFCKTKKCYH